MSLVNFTSGINNIEQSTSLSEWAASYISTHKFTRENFSSHEKFKALPRREKDAVRYQIRKTSANQSLWVSKIKTKQNLLHKQVKNVTDIQNHLRIALSAWISIFLLFDLVQIYTNKGLSPFIAWQTAILVEVCIIVGSMSSRKRVQKSAYGFLLYNILLFGFSEIQFILRKQEINNTITRSISEKRNSKSQIEESLTISKKLHVQNLKDLSEFMKQGYVSSGSNAISRVSSLKSKNEQEALKNIENLDKIIRELDLKKSNLSIESILSFLYFTLRCVMQVFSIWIIRPTKHLDSLTRKEKPFNSI